MEISAPASRLTDLERRYSKLDSYYFQPIGGFSGGWGILFYAFHNGENNYILAVHYPLKGLKIHGNERELYF
jgi:hypothetical protein